MVLLMTLRMGHCDTGRDYENLSSEGRRFLSVAPMGAALCFRQSVVRATQQLSLGPAGGSPLITKKPTAQDQTL